MLQTSAESVRLHVTPGGDGLTRSMKVKRTKPLNKHVNELTLTRTERKRLTSLTNKRVEV